MQGCVWSESMRLRSPHCDLSWEQNNAACFQSAGASTLSIKLWNCAFTWRTCSVHPLHETCSGFTGTSRGSLTQCVGAAEPRDTALWEVRMSLDLFCWGRKELLKLCFWQRQQGSSAFSCKPFFTAVSGHSAPSPCPCALKNSVPWDTADQDLLCQQTKSTLSGTSQALAWLYPKRLARVGMKIMLWGDHSWTLQSWVHFCH